MVPSEIIAGQTYRGPGGARHARFVGPVGRSAEAVVYELLPRGPGDDPIFGLVPLERFAAQASSGGPA